MNEFNHIREPYHACLEEEPSFQGSPSNSLSFLLSPPAGRRQP